MFGIIVSFASIVVHLYGYGTWWWWWFVCGMVVVAAVVIVEALLLLLKVDLGWLMYGEQTATVLLGSFTLLRDNTGW